MRPIKMSESDMTPGMRVDSGFFVKWEEPPDRPKVLDMVISRWDTGETIRSAHSKGYSVRVWRNPDDAPKPTFIDIDTAIWAFNNGIDLD